MIRTLNCVELLSAILVLGMVGCGESGSGTPSEKDSCGETSYAAIQRTIFEGKGCTQHG